MKKYIIHILLFVLCACGYSNVHKIGPRLGRYFLSPQYKQQQLKKSTSQFISAIITVKGGTAEIAKAGVRIITVIENIAVVEVPLDVLDSVASLKSVVYIESSVTDYALLEKSLPLIRATDARQRLGYTGKNVLVGIIDSGIDWQHQDFRNADGTTRIRAILDLSAPGPLYGGTVYDQETIDDALNGIGTIPQTDFSGHGTHVAGIAAGDGSENFGYGTYAGVAPESELIVVKATRDLLGNEFQTTDQIIALNFIDSIATVVGKPYVANLSFGGHYGAHDGTSPVERTINRLVGPGIPGKAVVTVVGNDRDESIHARAGLSGGQTVNEIIFIINEYSATFGSGNDKIQFDGWYPGDNKISVTVVSPSGYSIGPIAKGEFKDENTSDGAVYIWNGLYESGDWLVPGVNPFNGDNEFFIQISDEQATRKPAAGTWTLRFAGTGGVIDLYKSSASMPVDFIQGNVESGKISIPGTAAHSITAAAFVSKRQWEDADGNNLTMDPDGELVVGGIADFSSPGPTRNPDETGIKPDIVAPGQIIASSLSQDAMPWEVASIFSSNAPEYPNAFLVPGNAYALTAGTSMAAPHVAGTIALMFEKYPTATAIQLKNMLTESARKDGHVGNVPNEDWGWGKLDTYAALLTVPGEEAPTSYELLHAYPNPFSSNTTIEFEIPVTEINERTTIRVYNVLGQQVRELFAETGAAHNNKIYWDGRDQAGYLTSSGVYFIEFNSGPHREVKKIAFLEPANIN